MKKMIMMLIIAGFGTAAMAQDLNTSGENKHKVLTNRFWDNWFISAGVGVEKLIGNNDAYYDVFDRVGPTFNIGAGKWFTPGFGLRLQYSGFEAKGARIGYGTYAKGRPDENRYYDQRFHYMNLHCDFMFNLNALIGGYNPNRVYEVIPYVGAGFTHNFSGVNKVRGMAVNAGVINKFRVSPVLDVNLELSGMMAEDKFDAELHGSKAHDGVVAATVGVTYYFKNRGFNKSKPCPPELISEAELNGIRDKMNAMAGENQNLKDQLAAVPAPVVAVGENVDVIPAIAPLAIFFNLGSSVISLRELINLESVADQIAAYPGLQLKLTGYADAATGSAKANRKISLKRAEAVADALNKEYGISRDRMTTNAAGGVDKFKENYLNRMVMIEMQQPGKED